MNKPVAIKVKAPAKVNVFLQVVGRRPDGYHELRSLMQALTLADVLVAAMTEGPGVELVCDRPDVPVGEANIAVRAAAALLARFGVSGGVRMELAKRIPMGAGLGGGSSDAAAALTAVDALYGLGCPDDAMRELALSLGADVPFFLGAPTALAQGVGERLTPLSPPGQTWLVLVNPGFELSTAWVYSNLNFRLTNPPEDIRLPKFQGRGGDAALMASCLHNDLERVSVGKYPRIEEIKKSLVGEGALGSLMSGSGPTVFGVFAGREEAERAGARLAGRYPVVLVTATASSRPGPEPVG